MVERSQHIEGDVREGFKPFAFPKPEEGSIAEKFLSNLGCLSRTTDFKRGEWGFEESVETPLTEQKVRDILKTIRPDVLFFVDPFKNDRAAKFDAQIPLRENGEPLPAVIGIFSLMPHETNPLLSWAHAAGAPLRVLDLPEGVVPGTLGTVTVDLDAIIVFSEEAKSAWEKLIPGNYIVVLPEDKEGARKAVSDVLENHGKPEQSEWERKPGREAKWYSRLVKRNARRVVHAIEGKLSSKV